MQKQHPIPTTQSQRLLRRTHRYLQATFVLCALGVAVAGAQALTLPPSGANQKASVTQYIGPVAVTIDYSSPDITGPQGQDRSGKIWGQLVPYGLTNLGFGPSKAAPWRAGANQNTTFTVSHDVKVQGKSLAAGTYGLHVIVQESGPWTIIFSNNSTAWGSFFYDASQDALRVDAKPMEAAHREWLSYDFIDRQPTETTVALQWEKISLPFTISVPDRNEIYLTSIRRELQNSPGFSWQNWNRAANFALTNNLVTDETLQWANAAISSPFIGQENYTTLNTKSRVQAALGEDSDAEETLLEALRHPTATPLQLHTQARQLQAQGKAEVATRIFKLNGELNGEGWPMSVGLARAYSAEKNFKKALEYAKLARSQAPDPGNQQNLDKIIELLEQKKDFNATN